MRPDPERQQPRSRSEWQRMMANSDDHDGRGGVLGSRTPTNDDGAAPAQPRHPAWFGGRDSPHAGFERVETAKTIMSAG